MPQPPDVPRSAPYLLAQQIGDLIVRIEKLERRVAHQGETVKRLVTENGSLSAKLSRLQRPALAQTRAPSRPTTAPAVETARPADPVPDFTGSLRELRGVSRQAN